MCTDIFYYVKLGILYPRITIPGNFSFLYLEIVKKFNLYTVKNAFLVF